MSPKPPAVIEPRLFVPVCVGVCEGLGERESEERERLKVKKRFLKGPTFTSALFSNYNTCL